MKAINGFLVGAVVGSAIALLFTPMPGKKLRKQISKKKDDLMDDVKDYVETAEDYIKDGTKKAETLLNEARKIITNY